jgi:hypothetical protein
MCASFRSALGPRTPHWVIAHGQCSAFIMHDCRDKNDKMSHNSPCVMNISDQPHYAFKIPLIYYSTDGMQ